MDKNMWIFEDEYWVDQLWHYPVHFILSIPLTYVFGPWTTIFMALLLEIDQWLHIKSEIPKDVRLFDAFLDMISWSIVPLILIIIQWQNARL